MAGFDPRKPSVARVYDALIGGKDNFGPDREVFGRLDEMCPNVMKLASDNSDFLERAVTYVAGQGVDQFIDLGSGFPKSPATHETARAATPGARVAYVDNDPQVLGHLTAWCGLHDDLVTVVNADVANHERVLARVSADFDLSRPCCLILGMMPHFFEAGAARALTAGYLAAVAPGSYLIASSAYSSHERAAEFWAVYSEAVRPIYPHPPAVFATFFGAAELVVPGVSDVQTWRPCWPAQGPLDTSATILCGVARTSAAA